MELDLYVKKFKAVHNLLLDGVAKKGDFSQKDGVKLFAGTLFQKKVNENNWSVAYCEVLVKVTEHLERLGLLKHKDVLEAVKKAEKEYAEELKKKEEKAEREAKAQGKSNTKVTYKKESDKEEDEVVDKKYKTVPGTEDKPVYVEE